MEYGPESTSTAGNTANALYTYFGYDGGIAVRNRDYYTTAEWTGLVLDELYANRPVFYTGQATLGGHAFVCDGYDGNGFFHFNWGWSGLGNGYFRLNALNPDGQGTGGYLGGYNSQQQMISGIQPACGGTPEAEMAVNGLRPLDASIQKDSKPLPPPACKRYTATGKCSSSATARPIT